MYLSGNLQEVEVFYRTICKVRGSEIENYYLSNDCDKQFLHSLDNDLIPLT